MRRRGEGRGRGRASVPPPAPVARFAAFSLLVARPYTCLAPPPAPTPSPPRARRLHSAVLCPACARPCRTASPALFRQAPLARSLALSVSLSLTLLATPSRARARFPRPLPPPPAPRLPSLPPRGVGARTAANTRYRRSAASRTSLLPFERAVAAASLSVATRSSRGADRARFVVSLYRSPQRARPYTTARTFFPPRIEIEIDR